MKVNKNSSYGPIVGCIVILNPLMPNDLYSSADGTPIPPQPSHTETPTQTETRTHDQCGDTIERSQAPDDGCMNVRNMLSIEEVK